MVEAPTPPPEDPGSTLALLQRVRQGDRDALDELCRRHMPPLRRWARGRLPKWTRDLRDTEDLVQETLTQTLRHLDAFEPRHEGALQAYLRQALVNRVRDEVRRVARHPTGVGLEDQDGYTDPAASPLEQVLGVEAVERYEAALQRLRPEERAFIIARVEMQESYQQIAAAHGKPSADAARMAVTRALVRLAEEMDVEG
ncbi:MAG TPA: sigma-70 family RNA polymerase sigma factor [Vicinamibacterales bacterium]|nr:sigma-70 family RNA polymerase sigma factor [Vicinamibacterales bacterium]